MCTLASSTCLILFRGNYVIFVPISNYRDSDDCKQLSSTTNIANETLSKLQESVAIARRAKTEEELSHRSTILLGIADMCEKKDGNCLDIDVLDDATKSKEVIRRGSTTHEEFLEDHLQSRREANAEESRSAATKSMLGRDLRDGIWNLCRAFLENSV